MRTTLTNTILFATLAMLMLGCNKLPGAGGAVKYPPSWPIKELTIPPGAKQLALPDLYSSNPQLYEDGELQAEGAQAERRSWRVAFSFDGSITTAANHVEQAIKPLGYLRWQRGEHRVWWISSDNTRQVDLEYSEIGKFKGYRLGIAFWAHPRPDVQGTEPIP